MQMAIIIRIICLYPAQGKKEKSETGDSCHEMWQLQHATSKKKETKDRKREPKILKGHSSD